MNTYPRKCRCGEMIEVKWAEGWHDCDQWEYIVAESEKNDKV